MNKINRRRRWVIALSCAAVLLGIFYIFGTTTGQIRLASGIWLSPLAVFNGSNVSSGDSGTNVAVSALFDSERMQLDDRFAWNADEKYLPYHKIPWYSDLVSSAVFENVIRRACSTNGNTGCKKVSFSKFGREYHLYYERDTNLLWIVQFTK